MTVKKSDVRLTNRSYRYIINFTKNIRSKGAKVIKWQEELFHIVIVTVFTPVLEHYIVQNCDISRCRTVEIRVRDKDLCSFTRQIKIFNVTNITSEIAESAFKLYQANYK